MINLHERVQNTQTLTLTNFRNKLNIAKGKRRQLVQNEKIKRKGKQELHDRHVVSYSEIYCFFFLIISQLVTMFYFIKLHFWDLMACSCCIIQAFLSLKSMSSSLQNTLSAHLSLYSSSVVLIFLLLSSISGPNSALLKVVIALAI